MYQTFIPERPAWQSTGVVDDFTGPFGELVQPEPDPNRSTPENRESPRYQGGASSASQAECRRFDPDHPL